MIAVDFSDIISLLAFLLAAYSAKKTLEFNHKQKVFIENNDKLNKLLIEKETEESLNKKAADLSANFFAVKPTSYRLKVFNRGQATARNVRIDFLAGDDLFIKSDIDSIFPLVTLERQQSIELLACCDSMSSKKAIVKLLWDDENGKDKSNIVYLPL